MFDGGLGELTRRAADLAGALVAVEDEPVRHLLDQASLIGSTAARWRTGAARLQGAWDAYSAITALLGQANDLVATGAPVAKVAALLGTPITLPSSGAATMPHDGITWAMEGCAAATAVLSEVDARYRDLLPRLDGADAALRGAAVAGATLGGDAPGTAAPLEAVTAARKALAADPLGFDQAVVERIEAAAAGATAELDGLLLVRAEAGDRLAAVRAAIAEIDKVADEADQARITAVVKIVGPTLAAPPSTTHLVALADQVSARCEQGLWPAARAGLAQLEAATDEALAAARRALAANRAPIAARLELRGRLEAFRAKASARGRLEHPTTEAAYQAARDCLYSAPCDLAEGARLVAAYQAEVR